ncbi:hypothetical protein BX600DRAFT_441057 [Xylariales sp. PMI_506]|nr:hypothetical protein BX600DRAFT_441057 [Xylariales sp. PMI_506]
MAGHQDPDRACIECADELLDKVQEDACNCGVSRLYDVASCCCGRVLVFRRVPRILEETWAAEPGSMQLLRPGVSRPALPPPPSQQPSGSTSQHFPTPASIRSPTQTASSGRTIVPSASQSSSSRARTRSPSIVASLRTSLLPSTLGSRASSRQVSRSTARRSSRASSRSSQHSSSAGDGSAVEELLTAWRRRQRRSDDAVLQDDDQSAAGSVRTRRSSGGSSRSSRDPLSLTRRNLAAIDESVST